MAGQLSPDRCMHGGTPCLQGTTPSCPLPKERDTTGGSPDSEPSPRLRRLEFQCTIILDKGAHNIGNPDRLEARPKTGVLCPRHPEKGPWTRREGLISAVRINPNFGLFKAEEEGVMGRMGKKREGVRDFGKLKSANPDCRLNFIPYLCRTSERHSAREGVSPIRRHLIIYTSHVSAQIIVG